MALERTLLGLDFDGTLAPIVDLPEQASIDPAVLELLGSLSKKVAQLVVISGRDTDSLAQRIGLPDITLVGNHGMELRRDGASRLLPEVEAATPQLGRAAEFIEQFAKQPGVRVERKRAAVSVHYRLAADRAQAAAALRPWLLEAADRFGLSLTEGRMVFELRPSLHIDKGVVVTRLQEQTKAAGIIYIGDDLTDLDAFRAMHEMPAVVTLAVGVRSAESPAALVQEADMLVDGVAGVRTLLTALDSLS